MALPLDTPVRSAVGPLTSNEERVIDATLRCISRWGVTKTTLDDIAAEAGISRATIYRTFPGGKDVILTSVLHHEVREFFIQVTEKLDASDTLLELLSVGVHETHRFVEDHEALGYLLEHDGDVLLSHLAMHRIDPLLAIATTFTRPHLARFVGDDAAEDHAEWVIRNVISYLLNPSPRIDLGHLGDVEGLVSTYFLPVLNPELTTTN